MSTRKIDLYVVDILIAIDKIFRYTRGFKNGDDLLSNEIHWDASIRELEIIGEATKRLLDNNNILDTNYRRIVDFRNQINHGYFGIDTNIVWDVISTKLTTYKNDLINIINNHDIDISDAISYAKKENKNNNSVLVFLNNLEKIII